MSWGNFDRVHAVVINGVSIDHNLIFNTFMASKYRIRGVGL